MNDSSKNLQISRNYFYRLNFNCFSFWDDSVVDTDLSQFAPGNYTYAQICQIEITFSPLTLQVKRYCWVSIYLDFNLFRWNSPPYTNGTFNLWTNILSKCCNLLTDGFWRHLKECSSLKPALWGQSGMGSNHSSTTVWPWSSKTFSDFRFLICLRMRQYIQREH